VVTQGLDVLFPFVLFGDFQSLSLAIFLEFCSDPWSESGDQELDLEELTRGFYSSRAALVTPV
jgi:hypothetical protein